MRIGYGDDRPENVSSTGAERAESHPHDPGRHGARVRRGDFPPLEPGTYSIDPDADPSTPLRVVYEVPVEGWSSWIGAAKFSDDGQVGTTPISAMLVSITSVTNLVRHGCRDHSPADPPVGPSADDLATALADLAPFRVTSPPKDVTIYGYSGKHLELTVPDMPFEVRGDQTALHRMHRL